jgi:phosphatidylglycerol:prolipoprotein diacylglycerol transferase
MNEFLIWWQHLPEKMNPVIFSLGGFRLQYYGLMYLVAFASVYILVIYRIKREKRFRSYDFYDDRCHCRRTSWICYCL